MELYVKYARTIGNRMTVYKITSNQSDEGLGFVCSYKLPDDGLYFNSYAIVSGYLSGLCHYSEYETLQECLEHLVKMVSSFEDHTELFFEGKTKKSKAQEAYDIDEFNSLFE